MFWVKCLIILGRVGTHFVFKLFFFWKKTPTILCILKCISHFKMHKIMLLLYPPQTLFVGGILFSRCLSVRANFVCRGYTVFTLSVRPFVRASVRPSVTLCFLNNSKSHCWIFIKPCKHVHICIKPCKHVHICKTNTLDKKVRARGQFY